ncbi:MAG TPA: sulfotransferase [Rhizomicrobium sp.]|nr:sulfotransferase [Rhizomicrobium sp.]
MFVRFAIVGLQRTGTSYLVDLLGRHPEIHCCGEIFGEGGINLRWPEDFGDRRAWRSTAKELGEIRRNDSGEFLTRLLALDFGKRVTGFKILPNQNPPMLERILEDRSIAKILQSRRNALARYASLYAARTAARYGRSADKPLVEFKAKQFVKIHQQNTTYFDDIERRLEAGGQRFHRSRFEEINDPARHIAVLDFLGVVSTLPSLKGAPPNRGSSDVLSRFSNPEDAEAYLRDQDLMHWAREDL